MREMDKIVDFDGLSGREMYKYIERYRTAMTAIHDPTANKYGARMAALKISDPDASKPQPEDDLI